MFENLGNLPLVAYTRGAVEGVAEAPKLARAAPSLEVLSARIRPDRLSNEELLPLSPAYATVLGAPGLQKGSSLAICGRRGDGVYSVALGLLAEISGRGRWCALVDLAEIGLLSGVELGVDLAHLVVIPSSRGRLAAVLAALVEGFDVVLAPVDQLRDIELRRLLAKARQRRSVLVLLKSVPSARSASLPPVFDAQLHVLGGGLPGLEQGAGYFRERHVELVLARRHSAMAAVRVQLRLTPEDATSVMHAEILGSDQSREEC